MDHPKTKSTQPRSARRWVTLYNLKKKFDQMLLWCPSSAGGPRDPDRLRVLRVQLPRLRPGTNCIKIGLPGKLILIKRNGLREVLFCWQLSLRIYFPERPIFIQLHPGQPLQRVDVRLLARGLPLLQKDQQVLPLQGAPGEGQDQRGATACIRYCYVF